MSETFQIGQTFQDNYPPEAAMWCNENNAYICETTEDYGDVRTFVIKAVQQNSEQQSSVIRYQRDQLIQETDYMMMSDYPLDDTKKAELTEYRQALRDITQQDTFPESVTWPNTPSWLTK